MILTLLFAMLACSSDASNEVESGFQTVEPTPPSLMSEGEVLAHLDTRLLTLPNCHMLRQLPAEVSWVASGGYFLVTVGGKHFWEFYPGSKVFRGTGDPDTRGC